MNTYQGATNKILFITADGQNSRDYVTKLSIWLLRNFYLFISGIFRKLISDTVTFCIRYTIHLNQFKYFVNLNINFIEIYI